MASQHSDHSQAALDLMAQLQDPHWALEAAQIEDEANGDIGAGPELGARLGQFILKQPSPDIQTQFKLVLAEELATTESTPLAAEVHALLQQTIDAVLTPEDWDDIASAAAQAVQQHVVEYLKLPQSA